MMWQAEPFMNITTIFTTVHSCPDYFQLDQGLNRNLPTSKAPENYISVGDSNVYEQVNRIFDTTSVSPFLPPEPLNNKNNPSRSW